jgi:hypothetical protein
MKTIEAVSIWDNGKNQQATLLNTYAVNVTLNTYASFWYGLFSTNENGTEGLLLAQGTLSMTDQAYEKWSVDSYAWDWVAKQLNLNITGDYVPPVQTVEEPIIDEPITEDEVVEEEVVEEPTIETSI